MERISVDEENKPKRGIAATFTASDDKVALHAPEAAPNYVSGLLVTRVLAHRPPGADLPQVNFLRTCQHVIHQFVHSRGEGRPTATTPMVSSARFINA